MKGAKPLEISKKIVYETFKKVKANAGSSGIDNVVMDEYVSGMSDNLYKVWNRMSSGSYFPKSLSNWLKYQNRMVEHVLWAYPPLKIVLPNGERKGRTMGVPQGSVIGPLLANLFLHYVFDKWMAIYHSHICFERYADDTICHCSTEEEAKTLLASIKVRFEKCHLFYR